MGWLAEKTPPAFAQRRTLTALALSLFVPSGDERFSQLMEEFGKQAGCDARFDTIKVTDVPVKLAAEATAQAGHDIVNIWETSRLPPPPEPGPDRRRDRGHEPALRDLPGAEGHLPHRG